MKKVFSLVFLFFFACIAPQYLSAVGTINGTVTDSVTHLPISGALVQATIGNQVIYSDTTASNGTYSLTNVQPGNYTLVIRASAHQTQIVGVTAEDNQTVTVDIELVPGGGGILGNVTDALTTLPISGATISIYQGTNLIEKATTNGSGFYAVGGLAPGNYTVQATATGYQSLSIGAQVRLNLSTEVDFALNGNPGAIAGIVRDSITTNPIMNALVGVFDGSVFVAFSTTNIIGAYSFFDLAPGNYTVIASAQGYQTKAVGANVTSNVTTIVNFALDQPPGTIAGTVTDESTGNPIPGASINVVQGFTLITSVLTDTNGQYSISGFAPGNYTVIANAPNFSIAVVGATVIANQTTVVNFALKADLGKIFGTVTDAATNPIPGATVQVRNSFIVMATAVTDSDGNYNFPNLPPDTYTVTAAASGFQRQVKIATVTSNQVTVVNFALNSTPGTISGTVTDAVTTNPIPDATVAIFQGTTFIDSALTDVNGDYTIPDLAPGNYTVLAIAQGYQAAFSAKSVVAGMTTIADFALNNNPGTIAGIVTDRCKGAPLPGVIILVMDGSIVEGFGLTDAGGNYSIDTIAPGYYTVTAIKQNFVIGSAPATVIANATTIVNFSLTPTVLPPTSIFGCTIKNKFLTQTDYIHVISWTASPSSCVKGYKVYRNRKNIAFVSSTSKLEYHDHNRNKKKDVYSIKAVNSFGLESDAVSVTIDAKTKCLKKKPKCLHS